MRERAAGLAEGRTAKVAFGPEHDRPLLLGKISVEQWVESIVCALADEVPEVQARELGTAFAKARFWADEDVVELLRQAQAHVPVVLVTNASVSLEDDLAWLGLAYFADEVVSSARVGVVKPDRAIYEIAAERAGVCHRRAIGTVRGTR